MIKILQITNRTPYPPKDGGAIGYYNFTKNYFLAGCDVTLLMMNTSKHYVDVDALHEEFTKLAKIHSVFVDNHLKPIPAIVSLFQNRSYHVQRYISKDFENKLVEVLQNNEFDIIHVDTIFLSMYIPVIRKYSKAFVLMRAHNVEHLIWKRLAFNEKHIIKKTYLNILVDQLRKHEIKAINLPDLLLPISDYDQQCLKMLGCHVPQYVIPGGIDTDRFVVDHPQDNPISLFHLGSLDWKPNQQALIWFIEECWTKIHEMYPHLHFFIAGRNTPEWFQQFESNNIHVVGEVPDAIDFMKSQSIMIVPLLSGSGMRIKILEGMALGKTIITTAIGAEGIDVVDKENILIANTANDFLEAISFCVNNPQQCSQIGKNALNTAFEKYDNLKLVKKLLLYVDTIKR